MAFQEVGPLSMPPYALQAMPRETSVSSRVKNSATMKKHPKRVSICGVHEIGPPSSQSVSKNALRGYALPSLGILPRTPCPLTNPQFMLQSRLETCAQSVEGSTRTGQNDEINGETVHNGYSQYHSDFPLTIHGFPNHLQSSMLGASFLHLQQLRRRAEMAHYLHQSAINDAVQALLCLGYSPPAVPKPKLNVTDADGGNAVAAPSMPNMVQARAAAAGAGETKRPLPNEDSKWLARSTFSPQLRPSFLYMPDDVGNVNSLHRFVRSQLLELFEPSPATGTNQRHRSRVGLRCVCCARAANDHHQKKVPSMSTFFPKSLEDIYAMVCTWQRLHFANCTNVPAPKSRKYQQLKDKDKRRGKKAYWAHSAHSLGLRNVSHKRDGIMWCQVTKEDANYCFIR
ncbi:MAG: hypothetical protein SGBAC_000936 [Bacillariaceae sp.]